MELIKKRVKPEKGFTLVEIIVVLVVLAILAAFTIPTMLGFIADAKGKAYIAEAREVYVAAQAVATEYNATTDIMDGNVPGNNSKEPITIDPTAHGNQTHATGLGASLSSWEVSSRMQSSTKSGEMYDSPQWRATRQMDSYLNKDYTTTTSDKTKNMISSLNLLTGNPNGYTPKNVVLGQAAWIVTIGDSPDTYSGNSTSTRTGKVTKVVYYKNGYKVTIEGDNASVERY